MLCYDSMLWYGDNVWEKNNRKEEQINKTFKEDVIFITKLYMIVVSQRLECFNIEQ